MSTRRHLLILLACTLLVRGVMFISYPLGGQDDSQGLNRYMLSKILAGEPFGNLRYPPGYPLFIAPASAIGDLFGRYDERVELLFQVVLAATIPFLLYDILRERHSPRGALFIAILSLADPFALQWAHVSLPVWMVAFCLIFVLWLLHHAERRRSWRLLVTAGLVAGWGVLGRWNFAPIALSLGLLLLCVSNLPWRRRLHNFALFGLSATTPVILVIAALQVPATGVWDISCISSFSLVEEVLYSGLTIRAENGPDSARLLHLAAIPPLPEHANAKEYRLWYSSTYPYWENAEPWMGETARDAFLKQPSGARELRTRSIEHMSYWLYPYLGVCAADHLLRGVFFETVAADPLRYLLGIPGIVWQLLQPPLTMGSYPDFTLPPADTIQYENSGGVFGFARAAEVEPTVFYNGHWVWRPGIALFTALWAPLNALRFLAFPALIWAAFTKQRFYRAIAFLLSAYVIVIAAVDAPEPRIYAIVYPLAPILIGGFLFAIWERLKTGRHQPS